jgi:hypothetical protein
MVIHCLACVTVMYYGRLCNFHYLGFRNFLDSGRFLSLWTFLFSLRADLFSVGVRLNLGVPYCRGRLCYLSILITVGCIDFRSVGTA